MELRILKETPDYLAVYKPAGLAAETRNIREMDLVHALLKYLGGEGGRRPYLAMIHRLDQPVEGIVLFAKNKKAAADLSEQLQKQQMEKLYLAAVSCRTNEGKAQVQEALNEELCLTDYISFDRKRNVSEIVDAKKEGAQEARLRYTCLGYREAEQEALVQVHLLSGRHHQIRLQLSHAGMPILGDRKYGGGSICRFPALCAAGLSFRDPRNGELVSLRIEPENSVFRKWNLKNAVAD
ncbi:MAG: RNA pseudouridine synthase [Eubacteriales bacterium]|nr:RNA pseudouridine synthase [Eubacteriales bacterium]